MEIALDQKSKAEVVYWGDYQNYQKDQQTIFSKYFGSPSSMGNQALYAMGITSVGAIAASGGSVKKAFGDGGKEVALATLAVTGAIIVGDAIYSSMTKDKKVKVADPEYSYIVFAQNDKNETTLLQAHIVSSELLTWEEITSLGKNHLQKKYNLKDIN